MKPLHENLEDSHTFKVYGYKTYRNNVEDFIQLKQTFTDYMKLKLEEFGEVNLPNFSLENYHNHIARAGIDHHKFIKSVGRKVPHEALNLRFIDNLIETANTDLQNTFRIYKSDKRCH